MSKAYKRVTVRVREHDSLELFQYLSEIESYQIAKVMRNLILAGYQALNKPERMPNENYFDNTRHYSSINSSTESSSDDSGGFLYDDDINL